MPDPAPHIIPWPIIDATPPSKEPPPSVRRVEGGGAPEPRAVGALREKPPPPPRLLPIFKKLCVCKSEETKLPFFLSVVVV
jgi:hypothetical protein